MPPAACSTPAQPPEALISRCWIGLRDSVSRVGQEVRENIAGNALDQRVDQPGEHRRHCPGQSDGFVLNVYSSIFFFDSPVTVETPHISMIVTIGPLVFVRTARIHNFRNTSGAGNALNPGASDL